MCEEEKWYMAVLVIECAVGEKHQSNSDPLIDLQYRLIRATNHEVAYESALVLGAKEEHSYKNSDNEIVHWTFSGIYDLQEIIEQNLVHGVEVYSRMVREEADEYIVAKNDLAAFWADANKHKTAKDIIDGQ